MKAHTGRRSNDYFHQSVLRAWLTRTVPAIGILVALILLACLLLMKLYADPAKSERARTNSGVAAEANDGPASALATWSPSSPGSTSRPRLGARCSTPALAERSG